jgi:hypothetical protein
MAGSTIPTARWIFMPTGNHPLTSFLSGPKHVRGCAAVDGFQILVGLQLRFRTQRIEIMNSKCFPQSWRIILAGGAGTLVAGLIVTCHAAEFSANGSAGDLSAPFLEVGPASAPVLLDVPNTLSGGYSAYAQVEVGFGLIRASAHNSGAIGEDGTPLDAAEYGIEDVVLDELDVMSYRGVRPVCAVCQLNFDGIFLLGEHATVKQLHEEMEHARESLWPVPGA